MIELPKFPGNPAAPVTSGDGITSVASHLQVEDHEVDLRAIQSQPLSIGEVATTLTDAQNGLF